MDIRKLVPWNWFKEEEIPENRSLPIARRETQPYSPLAQLHSEVDRLFETMLRNFAHPGLDTAAVQPGQNQLLRPSVDIAATEKAYSITVEAPGVDEDNIQLELLENTLTVKGEKKHLSETREANFYRVERHYGAFQRILSLPEDADRDNIDAQFSNGVLTITLPRKALSKPRGKVIDIRSVA